MMAGNEEQMRMRGGWKGFPLPAAHWTAMTTFSPEAPSSLYPAPAFAHVIPSFICVHLPLLINSRFPHHNRSFSFRIWTWWRRALLCCRASSFSHFFPSPSSHPAVAFVELFCFLLFYLLLLHLCLPLFGAVVLPPRCLHP